ncbi:MAG: ABC transporter permease, partial [Nitratireductor sp.]|nr:ABC transporter permease [Nitratireductor sp.]
GAVQVVVVLVAAKLLFDVPFFGSLTLLLFCILLFVLALVLLGYTISTLSRNQMQAMQLTFFFFLPSLLLSGFMFPFRGMPLWAQYLGEIFPLTHFLRVIRAIMLKGADYPAVSGEVVALSVFALVFAALALARFRRTLD